VTMPSSEVCYYVFHENVRWIVEFDHQQVSREFPSFEAALDAAREAAEARWLLTRQLSCVRIGPPDGPSEPDTRYPAT